MKQCIAAILIPCLLLQLFGCHSYRDITLNELREYSGEMDVRIHTDSSKVIVNRRTDWNKKMDWVTTDSSILITKKIWESHSDTSNAKIEQKEINYSKIVRTEIEEFDYLKTTILSIVLVTAVLFGILAIVASQDDLFELDLGSTP